VILKKAAKRITPFIPAPLKKSIRVLMSFFDCLIQGPLELLPDCPDLFKGYRHLSHCPALRRVPGGWIYEDTFYPDYLTVGGAACAIFHVALRYCSGAVIDIGAGYWPLPGSIPVDSERGPGIRKTINDFADGSLDSVFTSHCLEHIEDWRSALAEWVRKLRCGGIIFLYLPHAECAIWRPGSPFVGDTHKWIPTPEVVTGALEELGCRIVARNDGPDAMFSFYVCARK
jgi:SAM-dependent methyltransferase